MQPRLEQFIIQCQQSSNTAYQLFKNLLLELDDPATRPQAFQFLNELERFVQSNQPENINFQFLKQNILDHNDQTMGLRLLQFPSTFLPEAWSFTFYEGLIRYPATDYQQKHCVELGCGIGWISIALALRYQPQKIYGLDINPKAIVCARLNLYLNALNQDGSEKPLPNGRTLLQTLTFQESNLFSCFDGQVRVFDKIIGCIPQVLNPEPDVMESLIAETSSDEYLHSLSNYFAKQGYIEDQFGLGLIASAVEQSIGLLASNGKLILNLGGRPGRAVLERLMQRRGFKVRRVWQTQVEQAADTEIDALVDIEKTTGHRFEFYMSNSGDRAIDARTALKYAKAGGKIYHSVDVYEASLLLPEQVKSIYRSIDRLSAQNQMSKQNTEVTIVPNTEITATPDQLGKALRSAIDLTYDNYDDAEERYSFLAFLAQALETTQHFAYHDTAGLSFFRQQLAEYFRYYLRVDINETQLVITPGRRQLMASLLTCYRPKLTLVTESLGHLVEGLLDNDAGEILQSPARVEYLIELISRLKPQLVIAQFDQYEAQSSQLVAQLIECAVANNVLLVIDLTDNINLSSEPEIHGIFRYLSEHQLSDNLVFMAGLIHNRVYQNYSLNITFTSNSSLAESLVDAAELTYSRTPVLKQLYYAHLLEALLFFQRTRPTQVYQKNEQPQNAAFQIDLSTKANAAFSHPAIVGNHLAFNQQTIRLDFGENELDAPQLLKQAIFESYLVRKSTQEEISPKAALMALLNQRFSLPEGLQSKLVFGNGVAPIYSALLDLCAAEGRMLVIPSGSYGYFKAAASFKGVDVKVLQTNETDCFKITPHALEKCLSEHSGCWLFLNAPIVNPTGAIYSSSELQQLLAIAEKYQVTVIMDCIFVGLEYEADITWQLANRLQSIYQKLILIGGVSKEFSAGGLRFGYAWSASLPLMKDLSLVLTHQPHFTLGYSIRKLLEAQLTRNSALIAHLSRQKATLASRAKKLTQVLETQGWQVIKPQGGLFLVAKPAQFILQGQLSPTAGGDKMTQKLFQEKNIVINNSTWTGLPGYCRFVLSCSEDDFNQAIERLALNSASV